MRSWPDHGDLSPDDMFGDLFPSDRSRPLVTADVVATAMLLPALDGLSDRDAAMASRLKLA